MSIDKEFIEMQMAYEEKIKELEAKIELYKQSNKVLNDQLNKSTDHISKLNDKLAEKEKEINKRIFYSNYTDDDMVWFAIEQLEKVKELFESCWDYEFDIGELCDKELFYKKIDNQIEELKKEMK